MRSSRLRKKAAMSMLKRVGIVIIAMEMERRLVQQVPLSEKEPAVLRTLG